MGRPKPLLPWQGRTLIQYQIESLIEGGVHDVYVVTGANDEQVSRLLTGRNVHRVHNPLYKTGKTSSIRAGVRALPDDADTILLLAVDQPRPPWAIKRLIDSHLSANAAVTSPRVRTRGGHPLIFSASLRGELMEITEEAEGVREIMRRHEHGMNHVEFDSEIMRLDLNTPDSYLAALASYPKLSAPPG